MSREMVVLGTASQAPTRQRNHNGYLLRFDDVVVLFDPGEGTQRQMLLAGVRSSTITHIAITHRHGDHTLGLPGVLAAMAQHQRTRPVVLIHPEEAGPYLDRLLAVDLFDDAIPVTRSALPTDVTSRVRLSADTTLIAGPLSHRVPTLGYRVQENDRRRLDPDRLRAVGLEGPPVGRLQRDGRIEVDGRTVTLADVSDPQPGQSVAVVMDTRMCAVAEQLMTGTDLALVESTFQDGEEDLAQAHGHLTAAQAGRLAADAGVRRLVLTHYSQRHPDEESFAVQARRHHGDVVAAVDLMTVAVPDRESG